MKVFLALVLAALGASDALAQIASSAIPSFTATALTGKKVSSEQLIGQTTILIVTPSKDAAADTRMWASALRKNIDQRAVRIRDVLAVDLPFFMSEGDAISRAKKKIPRRYYDQTWILAETNLETALNIPINSAKAFVLVLNADGQIVARVEGEPSEAKIGQVQSAVRSLK